MRTGAKTGSSNSGNLIFLSKVQAYFRMTRNVGKDESAFMCGWNKEYEKVQAGRLDLRLGNGLNGSRLIIDQEAMTVKPANSFRLYR